MTARKSQLAPFQWDLGAWGRQLSSVPSGGETLEVAIFLLYCSNA